MNKNKAISIKKEIQKIVSKINARGLSFEYKKYSMMKEIRKYYKNNNFQSEKLNERKNEIKTINIVLQNFVYPFYVGLIGALFLEVMLKYYSIEQKNSMLFALSQSLFGQFFFPALTLALFFGARKLIRYFLKQDQFGLDDYEIKIIDSILDKRLKKAIKEM